MSDHECKKCKKCNKCHKCHKKPKLCSKILHLNDATQNAITPQVLKTISILDMCNSYGLNMLTLTSNRDVNIGISIVGTYPKWKSDLIAYCKLYNLSQNYINNIKIITLNTKTPYNRGWAEECALDLQTIYTVIAFLKCSRVKINIIQAKSASYADLMATITHANNNNIQIVSMSWGSNEFKSINDYNKFFNKYNYFASSGDSVNPSYPSSCFNVCSIGGTQLEVSNSQRTNETVWEYAGCSSSQFVVKPSYQNNVSNIPATHKFRIIPDVSFNASPKSGVLIVFEGVKINGIGGTSLSCPFMAAVISCFMTNSKINLTTCSTGKGTHLQKLLYDLSKTNYNDYFYDVKEGKSGNTSATLNFDFASGLGVIKFDNLYKFLTK